MAPRDQGRIGRRIGWPVAVWTALIVASTLLVKQHYADDLVSGLVLAFCVSARFKRLFLGKIEAAR